jgi:hypothetical protein
MVHCWIQIYLNFEHVVDFPNHQHFHISTPFCVMISSKPKAYSHFASVLFLPRWVSSWVPDPAGAAFRRLQISWQLPTSLQIRKSFQDRLGLVETQVASISHGHDLIEIAIRGSILWTTLVFSATMFLARPPVVCAAASIRKQVLPLQALSSAWKK